MKTLSLVCNRIAKHVEPDTDISTPSPLEDISKLQLRVEQTEAPNIPTISSTMTSSLSAVSLLSSVMAKHANKPVTLASTIDDSDIASKNIGEEKLLNVCASTSTTVNACADFFNALLKTDKTLNSVSNQGN